ncbi:Uncharacterised protein [uncultured archaeon]|nr:Uncharacterised protein [uncultured archaeon]
MNIRIVTKKKDEIEIECDDKGIANAVLNALIDQGADAYTYEPHPLTAGYRLNVKADDPQKEMKKAIDKVKGEIQQLQKQVEKELKSK